MTPFLKEVAIDLISKFGKEMKDICIVFPNKRSGVFFRKYFSECVDSVTWSPTIQTIEEFVIKHAKIQKGDTLNILFHLHDLFVKQATHCDDQIIKDQIDSFERFFPLGEILLKDIDEIDAYLVDSLKLFACIQSIYTEKLQFDFLDEEQKEIIGSFLGAVHIQNDSVEKRRFIFILQMLSEIYEEFKNQLLKQGFAYEGLIYRYLAENIEHLWGSFQRNRSFVFVGFNALNKAQEKIFEFLQEKNKALFYWDSDNYYIKNTEQEAGMFVRENIKRFSPEKLHEQPEYLTKRKNKIQFISVPLQINQTKILSQVFRKLQIDLSQEKEVEETVIVIADENLLFPVLYSLPEEISRINITMGYPFKDTPLCYFLKQYILLQSKRKLSSAQKIEYPAKDILAILNHNILRDKAKTTDLRKYIIDERLNYLDIEKIYESIDRSWHILFEPTQNGLDLCKNILQILFQLFNQLINNQYNNQVSNEVEKEYIYHTYTQIKRLMDIIQQRIAQTTEILSSSIVSKLLIQIFGSLRIPFSGEPLQGIQIAGILETRNLDFKNLIILGANEGILPASSRNNTFLTESLRRAFLLPTRKHQDAFFSYYFYRLLQRSENTAILYNSAVTDSNTGEMSRLLRQLVFELPELIEQNVLQQNLKSVSNPSIEITKNEKIKQKLQLYLIPPESGGISLTSKSMQNYIACPLRFYFKYIAKIQEMPLWQIEATQADFGNIFHSAISRIYRNTQTKILSSSDFDRLENKMDNCVRESIYELFPETKLQESLGGELEILFEVIKKYIRQILRYEKSLKSLQIVFIEEEKTGYYTKMELDDQRSVRLSAHPDRIDRVDQQLRIIDYKTGLVSKKISKIEDLFNSEKINNAVFQLFFYAWVCQNSYFKNSNMSLGIYNIQEMHDKDFSPAIKLEKELLEGGFLNENLDEFQSLLTTKIEELLNPAIPFNQTEVKENCNYCDFKEICIR